ncbi:MAG: hypothetical protein MZV63_12380, partial [Marinilabiliales bacterium]|nr:hypothetical protein [Marinilabiliales bacterium]
YASFDLRIAKVKQTTTNGISSTYNEIQVVAVDDPFKISGIIGMKINIKIADPDTREIFDLTIIWPPDQVSLHSCGKRIFTGQFRIEHAQSIVRPLDPPGIAVNDKP